MTLMLIIIMTSVILLSVLVNLTMLKTYYTEKEKKAMTDSQYISEYAKLLLQKEGVDINLGKNDEKQ